MTQWTVYCHIHAATSRRYVGVTRRSMERRWSQHVNQSKSAKGGRWHFPNAIRKYGPEAFVHEVLEVCDSLEQADLAERKWIAHFDTTDPRKGFNILKGGCPDSKPESKPIRAKWQEPEYRMKVTAAVKRAWSGGLGVAMRARASMKSKETHSDPVVRARISAAITGRRLSPEHVDTISRSRTGRSTPVEVREKISASMKATMKNNPALVVAVADRNSRRKHSPATKSKIGSGLRKTHCIHGHSLDDAYLSERGGRVDRTCRTCSTNRRKSRST